MRTAFNIGIIISLLYLPWWLTALLMLAGSFMIPRFFEVIFYGILLDALYGTKFGLHSFAYVFSAGAVVALSLTNIIRQKIIW